MGNTDAVAGGTEAQSAYTERMKQQLRRAFEEIFVRGNVAAVDELFAPDVVFTSTARPEGPLYGREEYKEFALGFLEAFTDVEAEIHSLVGEGDLVVCRATIRARHIAAYRGIPAFGRTIDVSEIIMVRASPEGTCQEAWSAFDTLKMLQQLGVIPKRPMPKPILWLMLRLQRRPSGESAR